MGLGRLRFSSITERINSKTFLIRRMDYPTAFIYIKSLYIYIYISIYLYLYLYLKYIVLQFPKTVYHIDLIFTIILLKKMIYFNYFEHSIYIQKSSSSTPISPIILSFSSLISSPGSSPTYSRRG